MQFGSDRPLPTPIQSGWSIGRDVMPYNHFSHKVLKDAIALIQGTNPNFAFDEDGTLRVLKPRWHSSEFNGLMPISTNFSIDRLEVIQAASALLANIAFKQDHSHPISDLLKIKAHPKSEERPGALIQAMYDDIGEFGSGLGMGDDDWRSIDDEMQQPLIPEIKAEPDLSKSLDYLTRCLKAIREGDSITYDHDYEDDYAGTELF